MYEIETTKSTGGTGGSIYVRNYVFHNKVEPPHSGISTNSWGVYGVVCDEDGNELSDLLTNWTGYGTLFTSTTEIPISKVTKNSSNYSSASYTSATAAVKTYSFTMTTSSSAFGTTYYHRNGAF